MTNPKPLKEIKLQTALADNQSKYLTNLELGKAIKVPVAVLKVIHKINTSIVLSDILAHALLLRAASTKDEVTIRNWMEFPGFLFPQTQANIQFSKFLRTVFSGIKHHITENELELVIHFFAKCPHGYIIPEDLICSHSEIKVTST